MNYTNIQKLDGVINNFLQLPFFLLEPAKQKEQKNILFSIFSSLADELPEREIIKEIVDTINRNIFNELEFSQKLKAFLSSLTLTDHADVKKLINYLDLVISRMAPFYLARQIAAEKNKLMSREEIKRHDKNSLEIDMRLYALDYFLLMYKVINEEKKMNVIRQGFKELPSLWQDALDEDMLKKIIFNLFDDKLIMRMANDYYEYKKAFLNIPANGVLTVEAEAAIAESLKKYILSLINVSEELGVAENSNGIYNPYGNISLSELKVVLNN